MAEANPFPSEQNRHVRNALTILSEGDERSFVNETLQGLLDEIQLLRGSLLRVRHEVVGVLEPAARD
jgi:hypothetical protein